MKRLAATLVAVVGAGALVSPLVGHGQSVQEDQWSAARACKERTGAMQVVMVIDESKSLVTNDPENLRAVLVKDWIAKLLDETAGDDAVDLAMIGYGTTTNTRLDLTQLDISRLDEVYAAADAFTRDQVDTDHALAMIAAQNLLAEATANVDEPCPLVLWFTDGEYDFENLTLEQRRQRGLPTDRPYTPLPLDKPNEGAIIDAGLRTACADDGPVAEMRRLSANFVAIALNSGGTVDFKIVEEMVNGKAFPDGSDFPCELPEYDGSLVEIGPGTTTTEPTTTDARSSTTTVVPPETVPPTACPDEGCTSETLIDIPELATRAQIDINASALTDDGEGVRISSIRLTNPDGAAVDALQPDEGYSEVQLGDATIESVVTTDGAATVVITASSGGPLLAGAWTFAVSAEQPLVASSTAKFFGDYVVEVFSPEAFTEGRGGTVVVALRDRSGNRIERAAERGFELSATFAGDAQPARLSSDDDNAFELVVEDERLSAAIEELEATIAPVVAGAVEIRPTVVQIPILRPEFPTVRLVGESAGRLTTERIDTAGSVGVDVLVDGPALGDGCVRFPTGDLFGSDAVSVSFESGPELCVGQGETSTTKMTVRFDDRRFGTSCAQMPFELQSTQLGESRISTKDTCVPTDKKPTLLTRALAALSTLLLILIPLGLLAVLNRRRARFFPVYDYGFDRRTGVVDDSGTLRLDGDGSVLSYPALREHQPDVSNARVVSLGLCEFSVPIAELRLEHRAVTRYHRDRAFLSPISLLAGPTLYLLPPGGDVVVGRGETVLHAGPLDCPLQIDSQVDGLWIVRLVAGDDMFEDSSEVRRCEIVTIRVMGLDKATNTLNNEIRRAFNSVPVREALLRQEKVAPSGSGTGMFDWD